MGFAFPGEFGGLAFMGAAAILLIASTALVLPRSQLHRLKWPTILLATVAVLTVSARAIGDDDGVGRVLSVLALLLSLLAFGRLVLLLAVDGIVTHRLSRRVPKIFRDIAQGVIYSLIVLAVLREAGAELDALLTTSALLTAVIGLSLQDTLGNLFAGLSIQAQHPFGVGDWIQYGDDKALVGRVIEINWRATRVVTLDQVEIVIPNGPLARAPIYNFSKPTPLSRRSLYIIVGFDVPPHRVRTVVQEALSGLQGVLEHPPPSVVSHEFTERGVQYWIRFHIDDFAQREFIDSNARERVWYALHRAGIDLARPLLDVGLQQSDEVVQRRKDSALERRRATLRRVELARVLSAPQLELLAQEAKERVYAAGEVVVRQGEAGSELFIVQQGKVGVLVGDPPIQVAELSEGELFGEMSVMTGEARTATIRALAATQLLVVGREPFGRLLAEAPALAEQLSGLLAKRRELLAARERGRPEATPSETPASHHHNELLGRIRAFFHLP